jgi:hypothetical protein
MLRHRLGLQLMAQILRSVFSGLPATIAAESERGLRRHAVTGAKTRGKRHRIETARRKSADEQN